MEVAGLDYEKIWYKVLGPVIYHLESKTVVSKTLLLEIIKKKNMNKLSFYLRYINT